MTEELVLTENNWLYFKQSNVFTVKKKKGGGQRVYAHCLQFFSVPFFKNLTFDIRLNEMIFYMFYILCKNNIKL